MAKGAEAFRSIGEVAELIGVASHVLRYWETQFPSLKPMKRPDGRRYYRPADVDLAAGICALLRDDGLTIRGALKLIAVDRGAAVRRRGIGYLATRTGDPDQAMLDLEALPDPATDPAQEAEASEAAPVAPPAVAPSPAPSDPSEGEPAFAADPLAAMPGDADPVAPRTDPPVASAPEPPALPDPGPSGDPDPAPLPSSPATPQGAAKAPAWLWQLTQLARHLQQADASDPRWTRLRPAAARLAHAMLSLP